MSERPLTPNGNLRRETLASGQVCLPCASSTEGQSLAASRPFCVGLLASTIVFLSAFLTGFVLYSRSVAALKGEVQGSLVRLAKAAAPLIDIDAHRQLVSASQETSDVYLRAIEPLRKF